VNDLFKNGEWRLLFFIRLANSADDKEAVEISRRINEALAEIVAKHLKRFGAIATLPGKTIDGSLSKMEYVLDTLKHALLDFGPSPRNPVSLDHRNTRVKSCARNS
jgi:hypothetical protein